MKFKITNKGLYWWLIATFALLYVFVAFVSTLHAIDFFKLANVGGLAVLLGISYEIGQASVLFSILMTKNKEKFLPWALMILLTALQVTANVYASFKHMALSGSEDWMFWQRSILFGVQASSPEMYQIIISWISGALLPIVALGMTALVAQNIQLMTEENNANEHKPVSIPPEEVDEIIKNEVEKKVDELLSMNRVGDAERPPEEQEEFELWDQASLLDLQNLEDETKEETETVEEVVVPPPKKRGRPPKKDDAVIESKKEQELLPKEDVRVPQKRKRVVNPLKLKDKKIKPVKRLDEVIKQSKGDEVIELIEKIENGKAKESIIQQPKEDVVNPQSVLVPPEILTPYLESGVEVIEAKAVPMPDVKKIKKKRESG